MVDVPGAAPRRDADREIAILGPDAVVVTLRVNGVDRTLHVEPRVTLLDALRDHLQLFGTKKGCAEGACGACTVLVDGVRIDSCFTLAIMHEGAEITTIEGLAAAGGGLHPMQAAFLHHDAYQCGYCTPGQIVSAIGLVNEGRGLADDEIREQMAGNICRCGAYPNIVEAVRAAATQMRADAGETANGAVSGENRRSAARGRERQPRLEGPATRARF